MQHQQSETVSHIFDGFDNENLRILSHDIEKLVSVYLNKHIGNFIKQLDNFYQQLNQFQNRMNDIEMSVIMLYSKDEIVDNMKKQINSLETMTVEKIREAKKLAQQEHNDINEKLKEQGNQIEINTANIFIHHLMIDDILENTQTLSHEDKELIRGVVEEKMMTKCLIQYEKQISFLNKSQEVVLNERNTTSMSDIESCVIPEEVKYNDYEIIITKHQIEQIEEWTEKRVGNILFDSDKNDWNKTTSVFKQRIWNKENIIIIIEDEEGNKFGGYVNSKIDKVNSWINDSKSFVFSLESNGRMKEAMKFDIKLQQYAFRLCGQSYNCLFQYGYGYDICVCKENYKTQSYCNQHSFSYEGISNALCGKQHPNLFTPTRFIVIEMK
ncbi:trichohyalin, putative [Entamoeba histolytica]